MSLIATLSASEAVAPAHAGPFAGVLTSLLLISMAFGAAAGVFQLLYFLFSLPLRRRERVRLFLDLIESGLKRGESVEQTVVGIARSGDRSLGRQLATLAERIQRGVRFEQALSSPPRILPAETAALLRAGVEAGDLLKVIPACRSTVRDGVDEVAKAHHYLALLAFVVTPAWLVVSSALVLFVLPKFKAISADLAVDLPARLTWLTDHFGWFAGGQILLLAGMWFLAILYLAGPRLQEWLTELLPGPVAFVTWRLRARRWRMQRNFTAALGVLLDAGLPEARAVQLAAESAHHEIFTSRASRALDDLARGEALPVALRLLDESGELPWRLANATHARGGFQQALAGWNEALAARAFHAEQVFAQLVTTGLVLLNGLFVGLLAFGVFQMFTLLINEGVLW